MSKLDRILIEHALAELLRTNIATIKLALLDGIDAACSRHDEGQALDYTRLYDLIKAAEVPI